MKITIDTEEKIVVTEGAEGIFEYPLYSKESFAILTDQWLKVSWNEKHPYRFSWMGRPIIQTPDDMIRMQEAIYIVQPDVIIETGIAHGGSLMFYAGLFKALGKGRAIGIDVEIRPHNRAAIESHELFPYLTLIEGSSIDPVIVTEAASLVDTDETVMVVLDSCHTRDHVFAEMEAYHSLVSIGSYLVVTDGSMQILHDVPRGNPSWVDDNPVTAAKRFLDKHSNFQLVPPIWPFCESELEYEVTHWPHAWIKRMN